MVVRHVLALKRGVPVPLECAILNVPFGNTTVSTLLPGWSTPPAVNTPLAMMLDGALLATVALMSWKYSVPELPAAWLALATVRPVAATAAATATTLTPARILLLSLIMVNSSPSPAVVWLGAWLLSPGIGCCQASTPAREPDRFASEPPVISAAPPRC